MALAIAGVLFALGLGLIAGRIPPSWMYEPDGRALPRDAGVWRTVHVRLGWVLCAVALLVIARTLASWQG